MTKTELIEAMAAEANVSKAEAGRVLAAFETCVNAALKEGKKITLTGFLTLSTEEKAAREGRNPATGETMHIPAKTVVKVKVGSKLKANVA